MDLKWCKTEKKGKEVTFVRAPQKSGFWCNSDLNQLHIYNSCLCS